MNPALLTGTLSRSPPACCGAWCSSGRCCCPTTRPSLHSFGRYLAFGLIALPLGWLDRAALRELTRADWLEALKLAPVGNIALLPVPGERASNAPAGRCRR